MDESTDIAIVSNATSVPFMRFEGVQSEAIAPPVRLAALKKRASSASFVQQKASCLLSKLSEAGDYARVRTPKP